DALPVLEMQHGRRRSTVGDVAGRETWHRHVSTRQGAGQDELGVWQRRGWRCGGAGGIAGRETWQPRRCGSTGNAAAPEAWPGGRRGTATSLPGRVPDKTSLAFGSGGDGDAAASNNKKNTLAVPAFRGVRLQTLSYVEYVTGEKELYDLKADPYELQNLAATADPKLLLQLAARVQQLSTCKGAACRAAEDAPLTQ
ncbi:MAG: hypothetical protein M1570_03240, partial [Chloroflexi bacterium]|nr:hypothetical protein [Chloroflexota bacterium]